MKGYLRTDDNSHWYFIPSNMVEAFDRLFNDICDVESNTDRWYYLLETFNDTYCDYMIDNPESIEFEKLTQD